MSKAGQHLMVPINDIELDKSNPRINLWIANHRDVSQASLLMALGAGRDTGQEKGTTFHSLRESIRTSGGIIHPIIVNKTTDGRMLAIEGNTRLAIYRQFNSEGAPGEWDLIPAIVYDNLPTEEIDAIRLQAHLVGPRDWDPYSKARYLHHLRTYEQMDFGRLSDYCGGRRREVERYIEAYKDMEEFYRPLVSDQEFDHKKFSSFAEIQPKDRKDALLKANYTMSDFAQWVVDDKFDKQEHIRDLPRILANPRAKNVFLEEGSRKAKLLIDAAAAGADISNLTVEEIASALIQKLGQITASELTKYKRNQESDFVRLLQDAADEIKSTLGFVIGEQE